MADRKVPAAPNLSGIQDAETRRVLQQLIDGLNVRNGQTRDQGAQFVTRDEIERFIGKGDWGNTYASGQGSGQATEGAFALGGVSTAFRGLVSRIIDNIKESKLWSELTARIDPMEATVKSAKLLGQQSFNVATALDGAINGSWTVKFDADGYVCGAGLGLEGKDGAYTSEFLVLADRFAVAQPGVTPVFPFIIDTVGGNPVIAMNGQVYINATPLSDIAANASTPPMTFLGSYASAPATTGLKKNSVYKNTTTGNTYILLADAGAWSLYIEKGAPGPTGATGATGQTGSTGSPGTRGSMTFYTSGSAWSDTTANNVVTSITGSSTRVIGDTVTITNSGKTASWTKYWSGTAWADPGVVIDGNLLVSGTVSAAAVGAGTFTGQTYQTAASGKRVVISSATNTITAYDSSGNAYASLGGSSGGVYGAAYLLPGVYGYSPGGLPAVQGVATGAATGVDGQTSSGIGVKGLSSTGDAGVLGQGSTSAHGVRGKNVAQSTSGLVGAANGYNFYADGAGADYGTFTGAHDALVLNTAPIPVGNLVVDERVVARAGWSNVITSVVVSSRPYQKGVLGVVVGYSSFADFTPNALYYEAETYYQIKDHYDYGMVNALGEGQINVCGEGGDIETGDLIVTSSTPGVGMKQADDIVRSYTVAKIREVVTFTSSTEVKQVACIYLCG